MVYGVTSRGHKTAPLLNKVYIGFISLGSKLSKNSRASLTKLGNMSR